MGADVAAAGAAPPGTVLGLLLAGGEGRRMGGRDKGLMQLHGRTLVQHVIERLQPQTQTLVLSANRHLGNYAAFGLPVMPDAASWHGMGPLAALATLVALCPVPQHAWVQMAPCDVPFLPHDLTARLREALRQHPAFDVACPRLPQGLQPALLLAQSSTLSGVPPYLQQGGRSIKGWLASCKLLEVPFEDVGAFANANDPVALRKLEKHCH